MTTSLLRLFGFVFLAVGVIGVFLPLLPTTPFVLLAGACFARSSARWHQWLLANQTFGPMIRNWERHRCINLRVKLIAIMTMLTVGGYSVFFVVESRTAQLVGGILIGAGMLTVSLIRTCDKS